MIQMASRYCSSCIEPVKYLNLGAKLLFICQNNSSLSLKKYCTMEDYSNYLIKKQQQSTASVKSFYFCIQQTMDNRKSPFLGNTLLSYVPVGTHCFETQKVCHQQRHYSIKRKNYKFPELKPEDLEENFVRGSGPGGQSVNKSSNCVVLKHKPSGIVVKCHESRSLDENRKQARIKLEEKLDFLMHGDQSFISQQKSEAFEEKQEMKRRAKARLALKKAFKERENLE